VPTGILNRIVETKRAELRALLPREEEIRARAAEAPPPRDLARALRGMDTVAVMAEVKRRSPGAGPIRPELDPRQMATAYGAAGVAAVSVLTDEEYFGGSLADLAAARASVPIPVFRKDFIIHPLQLFEARAAGADGTLLIARILSDETLSALAGQAKELGLSVLVEIHDASELGRALAVGAALIGINNRNLQTFETSLSVTLELLPRIPPHVTVVSESGIRTPEDVDRLGAEGVHGILVGESILRAPAPGVAASVLTGRRRTERSGSGRTSS
jgi:indole-3-glycerol phosphate synthase